MRNLYKLKIIWTKDISIEEALYHQDKFREFLYMVLRKRRYGEEMKYKILYIGMAYRQLFSDRLSSHHKLWEIVEDQYGKGRLVIRFGTIILPEGKIMSKKLVRDVEAVLIQETKPEYNQLSTVTYKSNRDLKLTNLRKYKPLSRTIDTTHWDWV